MSVTARRWIVCLVWVAVGILLVWRGLPYAGLREDLSIWEALENQQLKGDQRWWALAAAVVLGFGKGFTALRKGARRAVRQIVDQGETASPLSVFSLPMILLVGIMIGAGLAIRLTPYDPEIKAWFVGILYPAIGLALIIGGWLATRIEPLPRPSDDG